MSSIFYSLLVRTNMHVILFIQMNKGYRSAYLKDNEKSKTFAGHALLFNNSATIMVIIILETFKCSTTISFVHLNK